MNEVTDIIDRPIRVGDFVAFYANVYRVEGLGQARGNGAATVKIMLADPSPTTRPVKKFSKEMCVIPAEEVTFWLLKRKQL
jgi:hypothetical protein